MLLVVLANAAYILFVFLSTCAGGHEQCNVDSSHSYCSSADVLLSEEVSICHHALLQTKAWKEEVTEGHHALLKTNALAQVAVGSSIGGLPAETEPSLPGFATSRKGRLMSELVAPQASAIGLGDDTVQKTSPVLPSGENLAARARPAALDVLKQERAVVSHAIALHFYSAVSDIVQDARDVLGVDFMQGLIKDETTNIIVVCIVVAVLILCLVAWVYHMGGRDLMMNVFPVGSAVCICVVVSLNKSALGYPLNHFSATSALITVVLVMEMSSFERFIIKNTLRTSGTILGGFVAVLTAECNYLVGHHPVLMVGSCFVVITINATLSKMYKEISYVFMMISVTFSLVFFGYLQHGFDAVWARIVSVIFGELSAFFCTMCFSVLSGEWHLAKSASMLVRKSDQLVGKVLVAVDCAYTRNMIHSSAKYVDIKTIKTDDALKQVKEYNVRAEVRDFFGLGKATDLEQLCSEKHCFSTFPVDLQVAGMQSECRNAWADMMLVRSVAPHIFCGWQPFHEIPNLECILDRMHPLYLQASALAHSAHIEPEVFREQGAKLELVREHIQKFQEPWSRVCELILTTLHGNGGYLRHAATIQSEFLVCFHTLAETLKAASVCLLSMRSSLPARSGMSNSQPWRFDSFCQNIDVIIAELSSLAVLVMKVMQIEDSDPHQTIVFTLKTLASLGEEDLVDAANMPELDGDLLSAIQKLVKPSASVGAKNGRPTMKGYRSDTGNLAYDDD